MTSTVTIDRDALEALVAAVDGIGDAWESGDLAGAVNAAQEAADDARTALAADAEQLDEDEEFERARRVPCDDPDTCCHTDGDTTVAQADAYLVSMGIDPAKVRQYGPTLATAEDVIDGRARYADTPGGHADARTLAAESDQ